MGACRGWSPCNVSAVTGCALAGSGPRVHLSTLAAARRTDQDDVLLGRAEAQLVLDPVHGAPAAIREQATTDGTSGGRH
eukprot:7272159-Prymnesium_polylepis.2